MARYHKPNRTLKKHENRESNIDPMEDKSWPFQCRMICEFLLREDNPCSWEVLDQWARKKKISGYLLRNMLAWLEEQGIAGSEMYGEPPKTQHDRGDWRWRIESEARALVYLNEVYRRIGVTSPWPEVTLSEDEPEVVLQPTGT